jgi:predicted  nucleic acid-binding Zn-ribbon protein
MTWFRNSYACPRCGHVWQDEWSATCDDDCPGCGARHISPSESEDLTEVIEDRGGQFVALRSADSAEDDPQYQCVGIFDTKDKARAALVHA